MEKYLIIGEFGDEDVTTPIVVGGFNDKDSAVEYLRMHKQKYGSKIEYYLYEQK